MGLGPTQDTSLRGDPYIKGPKTSFDKLTDLVVSIFQELVIQGLGDSYHQPLIAKLQFGTAAYKQDLGIEVSERQMYDLAFESNLIKLLLQETLK